MSKDSQISPLEDGSIGPNSATKHISSNTIGLSSHELMNPATQCELHTPSSSKILQSYYLRHDKISLSKVSNHLRAVPPAEVLPRHSLTHSINPQSDNFKKTDKMQGTGASHFPGHGDQTRPDARESRTEYGAPIGTRGLCHNSITVVALLHNRRISRKQISPELFSLQLRSQLTQTANSPQYTLRSCAHHET